MDPARMSDDDLRAEIVGYIGSCGPVTGMTRRVYEMRLTKLRSEHDQPSEPAKKLVNENKLPRTSTPVPEEDKDLDDPQIEEYSDERLRSELLGCGASCGPITQSTRKLYEAKLRKLQDGDAPSSQALKGQTALRYRLPLTSKQVDDDINLPSFGHSTLHNDRLEAKRMATASWESIDRRVLENVHGTHEPTLSRRVTSKKSRRGSCRRLDTLGMTTCLLAVLVLICGSAYIWRVQPTLPFTGWNAIAEKSRAFLQLTANFTESHTASVAESARSYAAVAFRRAQQSTAQMTSFVTESALNLYDELSYLIPVLFVISAAAIAAYLVVVLVRRWRAKRDEEEVAFRALFDLVIGCVREAKARGEMSVSVPHLRDHLLPPHMRTLAEAKRWKRVVAFIDVAESRISTQTLIVSGHETLAWKWVDSSLAPVNRSKPKDSPVKEDNRQMVMDALERNENLPTPDDGATTNEEDNAEELPEPLTRCLKVRGLFRKGCADKSITSEAARQLSAHIEPTRARDIEADASSGAVYVRFSSLEDAGHAFRRLYKSAVRGRPVDVKYLLEERFERRFPHLASPQ